MRVERIGGATLYLADNAEVMPGLPRPAALIGDPPYGQRHKTNVMCFGAAKSYRVQPERGGDKVVAANRQVRVRGGCYRGSIGPVMWPDAIAGDGAPFDPAPWLGAADIVLLWGAHRFADRLPPGTWLVWDKVPNGKVRDQGDGEVAWLNGEVRPLRIYRLLWDGVCVDAAARHEVTAGQPRLHPTQKPEALMAWCITQARLGAGGAILDPWMGSGSTGVAAVKLGHPFVGIECEPLYFESACRRVELAWRQRDLFVAEAAN